ncbi:phosphotransferase family protein [Lederbergia galactosidilytica]|uniref:Aminoglycoside phosphotransferase n=1 Tax=Lederbergia galactosidilytica TaxID=217031 RepID=A0A0Q9Y3Q4_9BACI|nr:aminoglycoside phosphotransferase family protein [Lederbergia galactosidilytica]KRG11069.1 aminoglycoside phosphotransferase [Virgibacillus soli]KRG15680.1 aminoglycoside phosphotransferase [Lederbergia galactosidilytica]MBP1916567.1 aminoglycoside phosphotransferase (APT) family kinase protein [Lederbergia galactosidilytica]OAK71982.1 aminoglycoside phosphotransferase [Lederbergia galactosidilytica]
MNLGAPIAVGNTAEIYLCDNKIIKVFKDFLPPTESLYEANKQKYVYSCGLPVPKILNVTEIAGKQAIIMEYVEGKTIGDLLLKNMERTEYFINISVEIQQNIHAHVADSLEPMSEQLIRKIQASSFLDNKHKSLLTKKLNGIKYEERLCHGDYHLFNLIQAIHDVVIIDWVDSSAGDIRADVCHTYLLYSQFSEKLAEMYLQIYCKKSGLLKDEIMQWAPIIAGAKLSENMPSENVKRFLEIVHSDCPH